MEKKITLPRWTKPKHLKKKDHDDLAEVYRLYKAGKFEQAMNYASGLDTIVREEIPGDIWKKMGGKLTPVGEAKLKKGKANKSSTIPENLKNRGDDLNPEFIFTLTPSRLLSEAIKGEFDLMYLVRRELANRGQDENGKWVGFDKAGEIHKI